MARKAAVLSATGTLPLDDDGDDKGPGLLAELKTTEDAEIHVYRHEDRAQPNSRASWCFACGPNDYTWAQLLQKIRSEHGGGLYSIRARIGSLWKGRSVNAIEGGPPAAAPAPALAAAPAAAPATDLMTQFQAIQLRQTESFNAMLLQLVPKLGGAAPAGEGLLEKLLMAILPTMLPKLLESKLDPIKEIERLAKLKDLLGGAGDAPEAGEMDWLKEAFGLVKPVAQMAVMNSLAGNSQPPTPTATNGAGDAKPAIAASSSPQPRPQQPQVRPRVNPLQQLVRLAMKGAISGSSAQAYAVVIADQADQVDPRILHTLLAQAQPLEALVAVAPEALPHKAWFAELVNELVKKRQGGIDAAGGASAA